MGVLNVTPDSFSDGGRFLEPDRAIAGGIAMAEEGADLLDIGGESTRPYSERISAQEECERVLPVIEGLRKEISLPLSIDTTRGEVARQALDAGASLLNDISALRFDPGIATLAAERGVPLILMHMLGAPRDMQKHPVYEDLMGEILAFLREAMGRAIAAGVRQDLLVVDPGIGFGKTFDHNLRILRDLRCLAVLGRPILLGTSNKAFIGHILGKPPHERDIGTMATVAAGVLNGAHIVRVHQVGPAVQTVRIVDAIRAGRVPVPAP